MPNLHTPPIPFQGEHGRRLTMRQLVYAPIANMRHLPSLSRASDPFETDNALDECELLDVLIDVRREYAGILLYVAGSLYQEVGNTYLIVARQLASLTWSDPVGLELDELAAHYLGSSSARAVRDYYVFTLEGVTGGTIIIRAKTFSFYAVDMPGMDNPLPPYDGDDSEIIENGVPTMDKQGVPVAGVHLGVNEVGSAPA